jgi:hypothetical protein
MLLVVGKALEDILEGVQLEGREAFLGEFIGLGIQTIS